MDRKALVREYKEQAQEMGVYRVHNTANGKSLVGSSVNLPAILNRHRTMRWRMPDCVVEEIGDQPFQEARLAIDPYRRGRVDAQANRLRLREPPPHVAGLLRERAQLNRSMFQRTLRGITAGEC